MNDGGEYATSSPISSDDSATGSDEPALVAFLGLRVGLSLLLRRIRTFGPTGNGSVTSGLSVNERASKCRARDSPRDVWLIPN
jgi:hypothetical protein